MYKLHPLCLHTPFPAVLPLFVAFLEHILWEVVLRPALQTSGCCLLTQNGFISLPIFIFAVKRSRKVQDQVSNEAAA